MLRAISLFSGCGGCSLGLMRAGFKVELAADIDRNARTTYSANLDSQAVRRIDLSKIRPDELLAHVKFHPSELDLIVGGPPCQGFSSAGVRNWADPRNNLLRKFVEIVTMLKPTWFVMENVEGLLTTNEGFYIIEAITRFLDAGYWVRAKKIYAEKYGVPQKRKRLFVIGNLEQCGFHFPAPDYYGDPQLPLFNYSRQLSLLDAIGDLPPASEQAEVNYDGPAQCEYQAQMRRTDGQPVKQHQNKQVNGVTQQRIQLLAQGTTMKSLPLDLQHPSFARRAFRRVMDGTPTEKRGGAPSGLKRLIGDEPSLTITSASSSEFVHPLHDRLLTLRECARIQSFPDWYEFHGTWSSIATQIGNAIPPLLMERLATQIRSLATWRRHGETRGKWLGIDATKSSGASPVLSRVLLELEGKVYAYAG